MEESYSPQISANAKFPGIHKHAEVSTSRLPLQPEKRDKDLFQNASDSVFFLMNCWELNTAQLNCLRCYSKVPTLWGPLHGDSPTLSQMSQVEIIVAVGVRWKRWEHCHRRTVGSFLPWMGNNPCPCYKPVKENGNCHLCLLSKFKLNSWLEKREMTDISMTKHLLFLVLVS